MTLNYQDTHSIVVENVGIGIFDVVDIYINERGEMTTVVRFFLRSFTARQGLHCFSLKISPKVWVNSDVH